MRTCLCSSAYAMPCLQSPTKAFACYVFFDVRKTRAPAHSDQMLANAGDQRAAPTVAAVIARRVENQGTDSPSALLPPTGQHAHENVDTRRPTAGCRQCRALRTPHIRPVFAEHYLGMCATFLSTQTCSAARALSLRHSFDSCGRRICGNLASCVCVR